MSLTPGKIGIIDSYAGTASTRAAAWIWATPVNREILERMMIDDLRRAVEAAGYAMTPLVAEAVEVAA